MESLEEGVTQGVSVSEISERDTDVNDSVADGLLQEIKSDVRYLTESITDSLSQLGNEAEWRGRDAAREADINQLRTDEAFGELRNQIKWLGQKADKNQRTLDTMIKQLNKDNMRWGDEMKEFEMEITRQITWKIDELTSKLRGGFIKFAVAAAAMIMLLCCRAWRLRKQKRSVTQ